MTSQYSESDGLLVPGLEAALAPGLSRVLAANPSDYTWKGTNTYILGADSVWIIDPGPDDDTHIDAVIAAVDGRPVKGICVTHSHKDHSGAAPTLSARTGAMTYGHSRLDPKVAARSEEDTDPDFAPDRLIKDGETIGYGTWQLRALHTPGHFPNHMCYLLPMHDWLFTGDHVMGWSTTAIVPPLGDVMHYLESLEKLAATRPAMLFPSHGLPVTTPLARMQEIRAHRLKRHIEVSDLVAKGVTDITSIVERIYGELPPKLLAAAEGSVTAHLSVLDRLLTGHEQAPFTAAE